VSGGSVPDPGTGQTSKGVSSRGNERWILVMTPILPCRMEWATANRSLRVDRVELGIRGASRNSQRGVNVAGKPHGEDRSGQLVDRGSRRSHPNVVPHTDNAWRHESRGRGGPGRTVPGRLSTTRYRL